MMPKRLAWSLSQEARGVCKEGRLARLFLKSGFERHTRVSRQVLPRPRHVVETLLRAHGAHGSFRSQMTVPRQEGEPAELFTDGPQDPALIENSGLENSTGES